MLIVLYASPTETQLLIFIYMANSFEAATLGGLVSLWTLDFAFGLN